MAMAFIIVTLILNALTFLTPTKDPWLRAVNVVFSLVGFGFFLGLFASQAALWYIGWEIFTGFLGLVFTEQLAHGRKDLMGSIRLISLIVIIFGVWAFSTFF